MSSTSFQCNGDAGIGNGSLVLRTRHIWNLLLAAAMPCIFMPYLRLEHCNRTKSHWFTYFGKWIAFYRVSSSSLLTSQFDAAISGKFVCLFCWRHALASIQPIGKSEFRNYARLMFLFLPLFQTMKIIFDSLRLHHLRLESLIELAIIINCTMDEHCAAFSIFHPFSPPFS